MQVMWDFELCRSIYIVVFHNRLEFSKYWPLGALTGQWTNWGLESKLLLGALAQALPSHSSWNPDFLMVERGSFSPKTFKHQDTEKWLAACVVSQPCPHRAWPWAARQKQGSWRSPWALQSSLWGWASNYFSIAVFPQTSISEFRTQWGIWKDWALFIGVLVQQLLKVTPTLLRSQIGTTSFYELY